MSIFSPKNGQSTIIITKKVEKILMSVGGFLRIFYFLTGVTFKFYQKLNFSAKNYLF